MYMKINNWTMTQHGYFQSVIIQDEQKKDVAYVSGRDFSLVQVKEHALLISAAPELLYGCQLALQYLEGHNATLVKNDLKAAILKATKSQ